MAIEMSLYYTVDQPRALKGSHKHMPASTCEKID